MIVAIIAELPIDAAAEDPVVKSPTPMTAPAVMVIQDDSPRALFIDVFDSFIIDPPLVSFQNTYVSIYIFSVAPLFFSLIRIPVSVTICAAASSAGVPSAYILETTVRCDSGFFVLDSYAI